MGAKQSITAENGRARAYSSSDVPSSNSSHNDRTAAMTMRYHGYSASANGASRVAPMASQHLRSRTRSTGGSEGIRPQSLYQSGVNTPGSQESGNSTPDDSPGERNRSNGSARLLIGSLPSHLSSRLFEGFKCPVCSKFFPTDEMDLHLVMCLTKPRVTYNEDVLVKDAGECAICLVELVQGDTIARLPCLCIYHKGCIDEWFEVNRSCPEHPSN